MNINDFTQTPRLYLNAPVEENAPLSVDTESAHYLLNVLRMKTGDKLRIFNGEDGEYLATITEAQKKALTLTPLELLREQDTPNPLTLLFSPLKKERLHFLIEKAVELGVTELIPILSERTNHRALNVDRAKRHIVEATEQSERLSLPSIAAPKALNEVLVDWPTSQKIFFCKERTGAEPLAQSLMNHMVNHPAFLIGPEGGFTTEETIYVQSFPFVKTVSLGYHILRSETAALSALGYWQLYRDSDPEDE